MKLPKRTSTHRTDTLAVRAVISALPSDWLIRNLEERDYGVDLQIEIFEGYEPTGQIAHIQVKGTSNSFDELPKYSNFPVRTIGYAERFSAPFFVFYTSVLTGETYFVWLQKYAATRLEMDSPDWRNQDSVTLNFPKVNLLQNNREKISDILRKHKIREQGVLFLAQYEWMKIHIDSVLSGNHIAAEPAINNLEAILEFRNIIGIYGETLFDLDICDLIDELKKILELHSITEEQSHYIEEQMEYFFMLKMAFLDEDEMDSFTVECCSEDGHPY